MKARGYLLFTIVVCLSSYDVCWAGSSWFHFGDWGPSHWVREICHWLGWCSQVCYDDLGCFENTLECHKPFFPPMPPDEILTTFNMISNDDRQFSPPIMRSEVERVFDFGFNDSIGVVMIFHGWGESHLKKWVSDLSNALLNRTNTNIIVVDWYEGSDEFNYLKAVQNTRVVGREVALFIKSLSEQSSISLSRFHLIGHSLGAHVAGYTGEYLSGIGRITALDAAGPAFEGTGPECRLDESDALFVDAIHTDAPPNGEGVGISQRIGHCDFYPNGGHDQPSCHFWQLTCNHARSYEYFIESLVFPGCSFTSILCPNETSFSEGTCPSCDENEGGCPSMGYYASENQANGKFYLRTHRKRPFCVKRHQSLKKT